MPDTLTLRLEAMVPAGFQGADVSRGAAAEPAGRGKHAGRVRCKRMSPSRENLGTTELDCARHGGEGDARPARRAWTLSGGSCCRLLELADRGVELVAAGRVAESNHEVPVLRERVRLYRPTGAGARLVDAIANVEIVTGQRAGAGPSFLIQRVAPFQSRPAVRHRACPGLGERDGRKVAQADVVATTADHDALDPGLGSALADAQIQRVAVAVETGFRGARAAAVVSRPMCVLRVPA